MAVRDQFITVDEMSDIQTICRKLTVLYESLGTITNVGIDIFEDEEGLGRTFKAFDQNGELLGHIGYGEGGFVLYLDDGA